MPDSNHVRLREGIIDLLVNLNKQRLQLETWAYCSTSGSNRQKAFEAKAEVIAKLETDILTAMEELVDVKAALSPIKQMVPKNVKVPKHDIGDYSGGPLDTAADIENAKFKKYLGESLKIKPNINIGNFKTEVDAAFTKANGAYKNDSGLSGLSGLLEMAWAKMRTIFTGYKSSTEQVLHQEKERASSFDNPNNPST